MPLALVCMFGIGAGGISMAAMANTTIQLNVPDMLRGRVLALYATVFAGSTPIGGLAFGALAAAVGSALAVTVGGAIALACGIVGGILAWRRGLLRTGEVRRARPASEMDKVGARGSGAGPTVRPTTSPGVAMAIATSGDGLAEDRP